MTRKPPPARRIRTICSAGSSISSARGKARLLCRSANRLPERQLKFSQRKRRSQAAFFYSLEAILERIPKSVKRFSEKMRVKTKD
ncbi:hypothetical protein [Brucella suis]|uniref:hypothetical protein n=1 Tax=Brucella suis TaxID=29461 RepID=UPI001FFD3B0D|nr:hypothetical protein [Brucella suis]